MTIAICYMSPEGVVLGADSTSSSLIGAQGMSSIHYLNHNQKVFELGEESTIGVVTWGLGGLPSTSHRTQLGLLADSIKSQPPANVKEVAERWGTQFWEKYSSEPIVAHCRSINNKMPHSPGDTTAPNTRTIDEERDLLSLKRNLFVGFFVAGHWSSDRIPTGFEVSFDPLGSAPSLKQIPLGTYSYAGAPNIIKRLMNGADENLMELILKSGKWAGNDADLLALLNQFTLSPPNLPIRDAIDFVYSCIHSTIKALKFSNLFQICGGPIEIAVITSDRRFRWVKHKRWDSAITEGDL